MGRKRQTLVPSSVTCQVPLAGWNALEVGLVGSQVEVPEGTLTSHKGYECPKWWLNLLCYSACSFSLFWEFPVSCFVECHQLRCLIFFFYYYIGSTIFPTASKRFVRSLILSFIHLKGWVTEYFPFPGSLLKWSQQPGLSQWKPEARNSVLVSQVGSRDPSIWSSAAAFPDALGGSSVGIGASRIPTSTNKEKHFDDQIMVII